MIPVRSWPGTPIQATIIKFPVHGNWIVTGLLAFAGMELCCTLTTRIPAGGAAPALADLRAMATELKFCEGAIVSVGLIGAADTCTWYCATVLSKTSALSRDHGLPP